MARTKDKGAAAGPPPTPGWLSTYADMITLMLCFFVLIIAMSAVDAEKFAAAKEALNTFFAGGGSFFNAGQGVLPGEALPSFNVPLVTSPTSPEHTQPGEGGPSGTGIYIEEWELLALLEAAGIEDIAEIKQSERGIIVRMFGTVTFASESDVLLPEARDALDQIIPYLSEIDNPLLIEGHTCDLPPVSGRFSNNWFLSAARAVSVTSYLEDHGIDPDRLIPTAYGERKFIVPNNSEANRQKNRRVDIVIIANRATP